MSKVVQFPDRDRIEEQACGWMARLDSGNITEQEARELSRWLRREPRHGQTLMETAELLDHMSVLSKVASLFPLEEQAVYQPHQTWCFGFRNDMKLLSTGAVAAAILLVALLTVHWMESSHNGAPIMVSTGVGETKTVTLADGSQVTLNTNSHIDVKFGKQQRVVLLERGEALFQIAHDIDRPFLVKADDSVVKAIGTAFNIKIAKIGIEVTVTDGIVEIIDRAEERPHVPDTNRLDQSYLPPAGSQAIRVTAGHVAILENSVMALEPIDQSSIDVKLAWRRGELIFEGESLEKVVAEVSRYTSESIIIADSSIRDIPVGGHFAVGDIDNLIDILEHGFSIESTRSGKGVIFLKAGEDTQTK